VTNHCPDGAMLLAMAEGRATSEDAARLREHASGCPACAAELAALTRLVEALQFASSGGTGQACAAGASDDATCDLGYDAGAFLDGLLDGPARLAFEEHAAHCAVCREELSDLMAARRPDAPLIDADIVARTLGRLREERNHILLRLSDGALRFVDGWIGSAANFAARTGFEARRPALAGTRTSEAPVTLHWESEGGYAFDCEVTGGPSGSELVGRVLRDGDPAVDMSVALRGAGPSHGPESVDLDGRFGPWHLEPGASELRFEALHLPRGCMAVTLRIERDAARGVKKA